MWYLIKSLFRYSFKNKLSTILLTILSTIGVFLLLALLLLSNNLQGSYNKLVNEGNLGNIVINENYATTVKGQPELSKEQAKLENEKQFKDWLKSQSHLTFREFTSLDYTNTANGKAMKVIAYDNNYDVDKLVIYEGNGLYDDTFDFTRLVELAEIIPTTLPPASSANPNNVKERIEARRELLYLATKAYWTDSKTASWFNNTEDPLSAINLLKTFDTPNKQLAAFADKETSWNAYDPYDPANWWKIKDFFYPSKSIPGTFHPDIGINGVTLNLTDATKQFHPGDKMEFNATLDATNSIVSCLTYKWILGSEVVATTTTPHFEYTCKLTDNNQPFKVEVDQDFLGLNLVQTSDPINLQVIDPTAPAPTLATPLMLSRVVVPDFSNKLSKIQNNLGTWVISWIDKSQPNYRPLLSKGYRLNFEIYKDFSMPKIIGNIINYGSQFAVVPDYVLQDQNKKMIPNEWYQDIKKYLAKDTYLSETEFENKVMAMIPEECKVYVDSLPYIVVGTGITPDFMYPVYSFERITPNIHEEALLYTTQGGFDNALNANRSNPVDSYIVAKFDGTKELLTSEIANINKEIPKYMTTAGQTWAFAADDPNNTMQPTAVRLLFLPKLVEIQVVISNTLSIFILVLGIIIFIIMLKKFIKDNQVSLAILRSNGYQKRSIIWSTSLFAILPCFIGGWLGYLIAWLTQGFAVSIYSFYWVIPTSISAFSVPLLLGAIFIPFAILATVCVATTTGIIKRPPGRLMNESSKFTVSRFSKFVVKPFPKMDILSKFRCSIAFSSMSRLIVLITMLSLSSTGLIFAFGSSGKFEQTKQITYVDKHYNMNFELETPTLQGGQYFRSTFENVGKPIFDDKKQLLNFNVSSIDTTYGKTKGLASVGTDTPIDTLWNYFRGDQSMNLNAFGLVVNNLMPSINDGTWQTDDINYLKNKMSTQIFTDAEAAGNNPWDIARSLAPENVQNYSKKLTTELMQTAFNDPTIYFTPEVLKLFPTWNTAWVENKTIKQILLDSKTIIEVPDASDPNKIIFKDNETGKYYTLSSTGTGPLKVQMKPQFIAAMGYLMSVPTEKHYSDLFYKLVYDNICMDEDDETYTYVNSKAVSGINDNEPIKLIGIKPDSKKVQLKNDKEENLNDLLIINDKEIPMSMNTDKRPSTIHRIYRYIDTNQPQPLIINKSAAYQYNLKIGDIIEIDPMNEATRYNTNNAFGADINSRTYKLQIKGIYRSAQNPEFYINQRVANKFLNLDNPKILSHAYYDPQKKVLDEKTNTWSWLPSYQIDPFNAFFTSSENPKIVSNTLTLYSIAGLGIADDKFANKPTQRTAVQKSIGLTKTATITEPTENYLKQGKKDLAYALGFVDASKTQGDITQLNDYINKLINDYKAANPSAKPADIIENVTGTVLNSLIGNYGDDVFFSTIHNVGAKAMFEQLFDNTSNLTNTLLNIILAIIIIISIFSAVTIALDLLYSSLAIAGILKALGYDDVQNTVTFTSIFIPSLIFSVGISIGLSYLLFNIFTEFVYSFSNILLNLSLTWYLPIASLAIIGVMIGVLLFYYWKILKDKDIPESIARY